MKFSTSVLGQLAKSLKGNASYEGGDARITVPPLISPIILLPQPVTFLYQVPTAVLQLKSFMQNHQSRVNTNNSVVLVNFGSGLWKIDWNTSMVNEGAVTDLTSTGKLEFGITGPDFGGGGPVVTLALLSNTQTVFQSMSGSFWIHLPLEQTGQFIFTTVAGLGTGLNRMQSFFSVARMI